jgi:hypothetical protein
MATKQPPTDEGLRELANWLPVAVLGFVALIYLGLAWQVDLARTSAYGLSAGLQSKQAPGVSD